MSLSTHPIYQAVKARLLEEIPTLASVIPVQYPEGVAPPKDALGRIAPYVVLSMGTPVLQAGGRTLNSTDHKHPHLVPFSTYIYGDIHDYDSFAQVVDAVTDKLLDFRPSGQDAQGVTGGWGYSYPIATSDTWPSRIEMPRFFTVIVNMSPNPES